MKNSKEHILNISFRLFLSKSYEHVTIRDIENATGLTRGAVFYYFSNKEDLFKATIDYSIFDRQDAQKKIQLDNINSLYDFINCYIIGIKRTIEWIQGIIITDITTQSASKAYLSLGLQAGNYYPGFDEKLNEIHQKEIKIWKFFIEKAVQNKEIRQECNPQLLAEQFRVLFMGKSYIDALNKGLDTERLKEIYFHFYNLIKT